MRVSFHKVQQQSTTLNERQSCVELSVTAGKCQLMYVANLSEQITFQNKSIKMVNMKGQNSIHGDYHI